ncbi:MAG: uroporphyrinogen decarboxylase family protein [Saccharofermentanales bacterium]
MTSKERVTKAIRFQKPDRVPYWLPEPWGGDILTVLAGPDPDWKPQMPGQDEWGYTWGKVEGDKTMGQVQGHPLEDYDKFDDYRFPDFKVSARYAAAKNLIVENNGEKFVLADIAFSLIHRTEYLRGHENAWTDAYIYPDELGKMLDKFADIAIDIIDQFAAIGADGIISCDDWGLQDRLMVSPEIFREFFKPRYARVYRYAHEKGLLTFLHSCGNITSILGDLIEAELDVIQMDQQENMGVENLARDFGGKICFWCPVDIQKTMITGSIDDVRAYAKKLIDQLGSFNGGFIAKWYNSPDAVQHDWKKINAMSEAFIEYGKIY